MKNNVKCVISFALGAGLGAFGGYKVFEYRLKKILLQTKEEEEAIISAEVSTDETLVEDDVPEFDYNTQDAVDSLNELTSGDVVKKKEKKEKKDYSTKKKKAAPVKEPEVEKGYESDSDIDIIPPEDFDAIPGFNAAYWTLYNDGVMVDDNTGLVVISSMDYIGEEAYNAALNDDDTVCVRNFTTKTDYHIDRITDAFYNESNTEPDETID